MREPIIKAIKNTFKLAPSTEISTLLGWPEVTYIKDLPALLILLANERTAPKVLAQALENVVVQIKLEDEQTEFEKEFLKQINILVDAPLYVRSTVLEGEVTPRTRTP